VAAASTADRVSDGELVARLHELGEEFAVPGAAVGVLLDGDEHYAVHGVTSLENPLPVDEDTLFQFGSTGKTITATAIMRLVEQGRVRLDAPVRTYVPELRLKDEDTAARVTVLHLLNHTAGWQGDFLEDTGPGEDAVARYVERMVELEQVAPLGAEASYNNASLVLAGRVIEKVTGKNYEDATRELVLAPLGLHGILSNSSEAGEIMTRRFAVGHTTKVDGTTRVVRPWYSLGRAIVPAGGRSSSIRDQIAWARFHLGDGRAPSGEQILSRDTLLLMQQPTVSQVGSAIGDHVGISWLLKDIDGVRLVSHGGSTVGQLSAFEMVPARTFAIAVLTNSSPNGAHLHEAMVKWALRAYLGIAEPEPVPLTLSPDELLGYTGDYESIGAWAHLTAAGGELRVKIEPKPEVLERIRRVLGEDPEDEPAFTVHLLPDDRYVVADGRAKGMRGFFVRDHGGAVSGINLGGRLAVRSATGGASPG
jgi:CubicO group peptidase (beta-lactamase class C family)